jgi:fatty acid-binding protein DegV
VASLAEKYGELAKDPGKDTVFISHGDCMKDVEELKTILKNKYGADVKLVTDVGPVIGAHSGPGTLALFFVGRER